MNLRELMDIAATGHPTRDTPIGHIVGNGNGALYRVSFTFTDGTVGLRRYYKTTKSIDYSRKPREVAPSDFERYHVLTRRDA